MCLRCTFHHKIKRHSKEMCSARCCDVVTFARRTAFEQRQPMSSSCARDLLLLWEHLQGATCVYVGYIVTPNLSIRQSCWTKHGGREMAGPNLFKIIVWSWKKKTAGC